MPSPVSLAYPNAALLVMDGLVVTFPAAQVRPGVPPNYDASAYELVVVKRVGGGPDEDDITDYPVIQVACHSSTWLRSSEMQQQVQVAILNWPLTEVGPDKILVDEAEIYVGEQEIPDIYPDERRVVATYRLGLRRQFRP